MTDFKTSDRDVNRAIRSWLHEDRHEDVSRVAGAVLDQVETTPQRRTTWWPARRTPTMNKILTIGLGAAAVVVVALIGFQLIGSPDPVEPAPERRHRQSRPSQPTPEPTPRAVGRGGPSRGPFLILSGQTEMGTEHPPLTVTIPAPGWTAGGRGGILAQGRRYEPDGAE